MTASKAPAARRPRRPAATTDVPPGTPARRAALRLLDAVLRRGEPLEIALHAATQGIADRQDRALAHAIAAETLRHLPDLDALIDSATRLPLAPDAKARNVLRLALAQALALGTPPHAAIATALPLVDGGPRKLVHGVFGTLMRGGAALPELPALSPEVTARWEGQWGAEMVRAARANLVARPPIDLSLRDARDTAQWTERLGGTSLFPGHVRLPQGQGSIAELPGYDEGAWWVQDLAASLPARLLGQGRGHVLDLCAAPGGKTMQLAAAGWQVTALDQSKKRLERLSENLARTGLSADVVAADLRQWQPDTPADAVLLDAPCTATGIFRRHPDVLPRIGPRQIAELSELQSQLLDRVADWVKPGGTLVYAVCSLEQAEGEEQAARFAEAHPDFQPQDICESEVPEAVMPQGAELRTLPGTLADQGGLDGFYIARFRRS